MSFNILANPFAVLGLTNGAPLVSINLRAKEIATDAALAAGRGLISPRTRLPAEIGFLPEASQEQVEAVLAALQKGDEPDLWTLGPIPRANTIVHLASAGKASACPSLIHSGTDRL